MLRSGLSRFTSRVVQFCVVSPHEVSLLRKVEFVGVEDIVDTLLEIIESTLLLLYSYYLLFTYLGRSTPSPRE